MCSFTGTRGPRWRWKVVTAFPEILNSISRSSELRVGILAPAAERWTGGWQRNNLQWKSSGPHPVTTSVLCSVLYSVMYSVMYSAMFNVLYKQLYILVLSALYNVFNSILYSTPYDIVYGILYRSVWCRVLYYFDALIYKLRE